MTITTEALRARLAAESAMQSGRGDRHLSRLLDEAAAALAQQASAPSAEPAGITAAEREWIAQHFDSRDKGVGGFYDPHEPAEIIRTMGGAALLMANGLTPVVDHEWEDIGMEASRKC